jgi:hypothetical protein
MKRPPNFNSDPCVFLEGRLDRHPFDCGLGQKRIFRLFFKMSRYCLFNCGAASAELEQSLVESVTATDEGRALFKTAFEYMLNYNHGEFIAILCFDALLNWELDPVFLIKLYDMAGGRDGD